MDAEKRRAINLLKRQLAELTAPERDAVRKRMKAERRERAKAIRAVKTKGQRQERERDNAYLAHVRRQSCIVGPILGGCDGRTDPAHLRFGEPKVGRLNPGLGRKSDDRWVLPLCRKHHDAQHAAGNERKWWASVGIDPNEECQRRYAAFKAQHAPASPQCEAVGPSHRTGPSKAPGMRK